MQRILLSSLLLLLCRIAPASAQAYVSPAYIVQKVTLDSLRVDTLMAGHDNKTTSLIRFLWPKGSAPTPTIAALSDSDTGIYWLLNDTLAIAIGGLEKLRVNATGASGNGSQLTSLNANNVASGTLAVAQGGTGTSNGSITGTGGLTFTAGGTNQNVTIMPSGTGNTILNGNVGVGTTSPATTLSVTGTLLASSGADNTIAQFRNNNAQTRIQNSATGLTDIVSFNAVGNADGAFNFGGYSTASYMRITTSGNIGVGTTTFGTSLARGLAMASGTAAITSPAGISQLWVQNYAAGDARWYFMSEKNTAKVILGAGKVLADSLELTTDNAVKPATNTWTIASDARLKKNVSPFTEGLVVLDKIDPVWYEYNGKGGIRVTGRQVGVLAQDVQKVVPYTVSTYKAKLNPEDTQDTELLNFNNNALIYVTINAVKELEVQLVKQQEQLEALRQELARLKHKTTTALYRRKE